jgi:hypothetical protein
MIGCLKKSDPGFLIKSSGQKVAKYKLTLRVKPYSPWHILFRDPTENPHQSVRSSDPKGFVPSYKTLDLVADQSLVTNSTYASNFRKSKIYKAKLAANFFSGPPKINRGT